MKNLFFVPSLCTTLSILLLLLIVPNSCAAHWIAGYVEDAIDTTSPNGRTVRLYSPANSQEIFTTVGPAGQAGISNIYMIDCEMLATPCQVGDTLNITITQDGSGYTAKKPVQLTVTSAGFDMAPNLSLNTPITFTNLTLEDSLSSPENEIDLTPASTTKVTCSSILSDPDGATSIVSIEARLFSFSSSWDSTDDKNTHYTNNTCSLDISYGDTNQAQLNCTFQLEYYAEPGTWTCQVNATDNYSSSKLESDQSQVNTLLALGVESPLYFGELEIEEVSSEQTVNVTNYGNIAMNLTLNGYGSTPGDGSSMECGTIDIDVNLMKFNLTQSNSSNLTLEEFEAIYQNLTINPTTHSFNLNSRQNDILNDANKSTHWRVYVPQGITNDCTGNIVFAATQS